MMKAVKSVGTVLGAVFGTLILVAGLAGCGGSGGGRAAAGDGANGAGDSSTDGTSGGIVAPGGGPSAGSGQGNGQGDGSGIVDPGDAPAKKAKPKPKAADASAYYDGESDRYYFQSESKNHFCAITGDSADCTSFAFPTAVAPKVEAGDGSGVKLPPDSIEVTTSSAASLWASGDPANALHGDVSSGHATNKVLPYGSRLAVGSTTCVVAEDTGVTCRTGSHGFRLSSSAYKLW